LQLAIYAGLESHVDAKDSSDTVARQSLAEFVAEYAACGKEVAITQQVGYRTERWSYARVGAVAFQFARELEARGINKGDAVLLWGEASALWVSVFLGCVARGAVVVPIDEVSTPDFAARVVLEVDARLVVHSRKLVAPAGSVATLELESLPELLAGHPNSAYSSPLLTRSDTLEIIFTSGTTAEPRGVVISHGNAMANIEPLEREIRKYLRYERLVHPLRFLNLLPMSHIFGQFMGLFIPPLLKATVIFSGSLKPSLLVDTIRRERVSVLVSVPRVIESLQREVERRVDERNVLGKFWRDFNASEKKHFLKRWWIFRKVRRQFGWKFWAFISGGAALPETVETFWTRLGYAVIQGYGMTETTSLISLNHPFRSARGSIGGVFPGMEVRVDESGEILVRGESVAASYRHGQKLESVAGEDGWFRTGDLAEVDAGGHLYFKGRRKNVIVTPAGMKVYPADLEGALRNQSGVRDCVVIGLEREGNAEPCAVLLLDKNANGASVIEAANRELAEYQRMQQWVVWPEPDFPRTATQKPLLPRIRDVVEARLAGSEVAKPNGDSLAGLIARITGRSVGEASGSAGLESELNLSSLDRVELMSALEDRYQTDLSEVKFSQARTVGQLQQLLKSPAAASTEYKFPRWPQSKPMTFIRLTAYYLLTWPATYLLAAPRISGRENLREVSGPALIISNHVTYIDIGWILAALPARFRNRLATAMRGERLAVMLDPLPSTSFIKRVLEFLSYYLALGLFNVFPLPKESGFLKSFSYTGDLADRGWNILIFPEGITTTDGHLARFRSGVGLLATRLNLPVIPMRLDGLFEVKQGNRKFARPGQVKVKIGKPLRFSPERDVDEIARELERAVAEL
jgi:long-chain acyl-CoA synthetase